MRVNTEVLDGAALNWVVATIVKIPQDHLVIEDGRPVIYREVLGQTNKFQCRFISEWAQGGLILEAEGISLGLDLFNNWRASNVYDHAFVSDKPLVAVMRAYVDVHKGSEVEIPDEIIEIEKVI